MLNRMLPLLAAVALAPVAFAGCAAEPNDPSAVVDQSPAAEVGGHALTVTGCLRGGEITGTYVVTADAEPLTSLASRAATGELPTYTYVLESQEDLAPYVGHQVEVTGTLGDQANLEHDSSETTKLAEGTSQGEPVTPTIDTTQEVDLELHELDVRQVRTLADSCDAGTAR
ncbi:MAG: hypothetical protein AB7H88_11885 [Vicinamibacterales bacterium]